MNAVGSVDPTLPPPRGLGEPDDAEITPEMVRANAVTAFIGSPLFPEPDQLRDDNITTLLSLSVEGPAQKSGLSTLRPGLLATVGGGNLDLVGTAFCSSERSPPVRGHAPPGHHPSGPLHFFPYS